MMTGIGLPSLTTSSPKTGFELAIELSRLAIRLAQPSDEILARMRSDYDQNTAMALRISQLLLTNFQAIAAANHYWKF